MHIQTCWEYELGAPGLGVGMIKKNTGYIRSFV